RHLAKALLCPERAGAEPCGICGVCQEIQAGSAVDVIEIDGASNRKIDDVRTLRENVKYAPARGRVKVYIIDEVHQLTGDAFDALLKTLEEPPAHVVFILATTDPRDIPAEVRRFAAAMIAHDAAAALEAIDRAARDGEDLGALVRETIEVWRRVLVLKAAPTAKLPDLTPTEVNELHVLGEPVSLDELLYVLRAFLEADAQLRESPQPRVELEIAAVRAAR